MISLCVLQPSFDKVVPPSFFELGLAELVSIYNELCENGKRPPVIDAAELQKDPEVFQFLNMLDFDSLMKYENKITFCSFNEMKINSKRNLNRRNICICLPFGKRMTIYIVY